MSIVATRKIGEGTYGRVYKTKDNNEDVALKVNSTEAATSGCASLRELEFLVLADHPHIVKLMKIKFGDEFDFEMSPSKRETKTDNVHFMFEVADADLDQVIYNHDNDEEQIKHIIVQILLGLEFLHNKRIIHRDLKPNNIFIFIEDDNITAKIGDFGLSSHSNDQEMKTPAVMTLWYRAPEIARGENYGHLADIWSLGCIFYEMIAKKTLFAGRDLKKLCREHENFCSSSLLLDERLDRAKLNISNACRQLLKKMLMPVKKRISATEALDEPYFDDYRKYIDGERAKFEEDVLAPLSKKMLIRYDDNHVAVHNEAIRIFKNRKSHRRLWYKHKVLIHGLDLFCNIYAKDKHILQSFNIDAIQLFYICLYMFYKYFSSMSLIDSVQKFCSRFCNDTATIRKVSKVLPEVEMNIIKSLGYVIYRQTIYEVPDHFHYTLTSQDILNLLSIMKDTSLTGHSLLKIFSCYYNNICASS